MLLIVDIQGARPPSFDNMQSLKYKTGDTRALLNELEGANIFQGYIRVNPLKRLTIDGIFNSDFVSNLNKALFSDV